MTGRGNVQWWGPRFVAPVRTPDWPAKPNPCYPEVYEGQAPPYADDPSLYNPLFEEGVIIQRQGEYATMSPDARPKDSQTFHRHGEHTSTVDTVAAGQFVSVATLPVGDAREGRILQAAGAEIAGPGDDIRWRFVIDGETPSDIPPWTGIWADLTKPRDFLLHFAQCSTITLQAFIPTPNRTVQAYIIGWTAPITRGQGRTSAGYQPQG